MDYLPNPIYELEVLKEMDSIMPAVSPETKPNYKACYHDVFFAATKIRLSDWMKDPR